MLSFGLKFTRGPPSTHDKSQHHTTTPTGDAPHTIIATRTAVAAQDASRMRPSQPMTIPSRSRDSSRSSSSSRTLITPTKTRSIPKGRHVASAPHKEDALTPAVAALLAMTSIPPRKHNKRRSARSRRISIDELVQEWRTDAIASSPCGSHKNMEILLESTETTAVSSVAEEYPSFLTASRSTSSDSMPSLDGGDGEDDRSVSSFNAPSTPGSLRLGRSGSIGSSARKSATRPIVAVESCEDDHPLFPSATPDHEHEDDVSGLPTPTPSSPIQKSSFKSNLTASLNSLKSRALSSLSQLSLNNAGPNLSNTPYSLPDDMLWKHSYIFPRLSPEVRPVSFSGLPESASRRYFNPTRTPPPSSPPTFQDQQRHYCIALQAPASTAPVTERRSMMIQMQTYTRNAKRVGVSSNTGNKRSSTADPSSEAARIANGPPLVRQREPRENSDFLRVVVLEMNMRRVGKLDETAGGRARIWLPPRQQCAQPQQMSSAFNEKSAACASTLPGRKVPRRWVAVAAHEV